MQRRESKIMRTVLTNLMNDNFDVVSIHDAVIMLDTENNRKNNTDIVKNRLEFELQAAYIEEGLGCSLGW